MKAMILAAGRGSRMRPLTDTIPKPLLKVAGKSLIIYHIEKCVAAGITEIIINHAWLGEKIEASLGNGSQFGAKITYSAEVSGGMETAGGVIQALPFLGEEAFLLISADVWTDMDYALLSLPEKSLAHLVLVKNPAHHIKGDFSLNKMGSLIKAEQVSYTYSGIGLYHPDLFATYKAGRLALRPVLEQAIAKQQLTGEVFQREWSDVGTPERLAQLSETTG